MKTSVIQSMMLLLFFGLTTSHAQKKDSIAAKPVQQNIQEELKISVLGNTSQIINQAAVSATPASTAIHNSLKNELIILSGTIAITTRQALASRPDIHNKLKSSILTDRN